MSKKAQNNSLMCSIVMLCSNKSTKRALGVYILDLKILEWQRADTEGQVFALEIFY